MGYYATIFQCVGCRQTLNTKQRMYSHGTCPKCGHRGVNAVTIVECIAIAGYFDEPHEAVGKWFRKTWASLVARLKRVKKKGA